MPRIDGANIVIGRLRGGFAVSWIENGRRRRHRLEARTAGEAEAEAVAVFQRERRHDVRRDVEGLWSAYRAEREGRRVAVAMGAEWVAMGPFWGALDPTEITRDHSLAYMARRRANGIKDGTLWTELGRLRTVLKWAAAPERALIPFAAEVVRPPLPAPKDRWLTRPEIGRLLDATPTPHVRLAMLLMLSTAARPTAALELTWGRVDLDLGRIDLRLTSDGPRKGRAVVPINAGLRAALLEARAGALTDHVVEWGGRPAKSIKVAFGAACRRAGLRGVTPHTLRHTAAVHMVAGGAPMSRVSQYLGHTSIAVTERVYARYAPEHLLDEAALVDFGGLYATG